MVTIISSGSIAFASGSINSITVTQPVKIAIIRLPGVNKDVIQRFGTSNREFTISGIVTVGGGTAYLSGLNGNTGSLTYSNPIETAISTVSVMFYNLKFKDSGNRPMERAFTLEAVEIL